MQDLIRNVKAIGTLFTAFGLGGDEKRIAIYAEALRDIPTELLEATCRKIMLESTQMPKIAEIVAAAKSLVGEKDGSRVKGWDEAWAEIMAQASRTSFYADGSFYTPPWENELARKTAVRFGWRNLCGMEEKNYNSAHAQCREIYQNIIRRNKEQAINIYVLNLPESKKLDHSSGYLYRSENAKTDSPQASYPMDKENAPKSVKTILAKMKEAYKNGNNV